MQEVSAEDEGGARRPAQRDLFEADLGGGALKVRPPMAPRHDGGGAVLSGEVAQRDDRGHRAAVACLRQWEVVAVKRLLTEARLWAPEPDVGDRGRAAEQVGDHLDQPSVGEQPADLGYPLEDRRSPVGSGDALVVLPYLVGVFEQRFAARGKLQRSGGIEQARHGDPTVSIDAVTFPKVHAGIIAQCG